MQVPFQASEAAGGRRRRIQAGAPEERRIRCPSPPPLPPMSGHLDRLARPCEFGISPQPALPPFSPRPPSISSLSLSRRDSRRVDWWGLDSRSRPRRASVISGVDTGFRPARLISQSGLAALRRVGASSTGWMEPVLFCGFHAARFAWPLEFLVGRQPARC
jgi:hypothetical protein